MRRFLIFISLAFLLPVGNASIAADAPLRWYMPGGPLELSAAAPLFEICTAIDEKEPRARKITDKDFRLMQHIDSGDQTRQVVFSDPPDEWGGNIRVVITYTDAGREVLARLSIESDSYFPIRLVRFPVVDTWPVNRFDTMLVSTGVGDAMHDPRVMISTRLGGIFSRRYPADIAMQYMTLYNSARSFYLACYDKTAEFYDHTVRTKGDALRLSFDWYPFLDNGGKWESPQCSISVLKGDWHSAADLYREHMASQFRPPDLPQWMREDFHGWIQFSLKGGDPKPAYKFTDLPRLYKESVEPHGLNTMHIFSWQDGGFHLFPDFRPSPKCGTGEELAHALDEIKAMGGRVDLYTHGSAVDESSDFFKNGGDRSIIRTEFGATVGSPWDRTPINRVCPFDKSFQDYFLQQYRNMITQYHAHGAQIDTNACIPAYFCFDDSHGHLTPATGWLPGHDALLGRLHSLYRSLDPDFFVWVEGVNERFGQYYEVNQGHGEHQSWSAGESMPEQFAYTYPDYLCTGSSDSIDGLCHTFGQGKPFDIHAGPRLQDPIYTGLLRDFVRVRKSEPDYFLRGTFKDTVGLNVAGKDIKFWRIDKSGGPGVLVNFWARGRATGDACEAYIRMPEGSKSDSTVRAVYPADLEITESGRWRHLTWTGPVATIVFDGLVIEQAVDEGED